MGEPELGKGLFGYRRSAVNQIIADRDIMLRQAEGRVRAAESKVADLEAELGAMRERNSRMDEQLERLRQQLDAISQSAGAVAAAPAAPWDEPREGLAEATRTIPEDAATETSPTDQGFESFGPEGGEEFTWGTEAEGQAQGASFGDVYDTSYEPPHESGAVEAGVDVESAQEYGASFGGEQPEGQETSELGHETPSFGEADVAPATDADAFAELAGFGSEEEVPAEDAGEPYGGPTDYGAELYGEPQYGVEDVAVQDGAEEYAAPDYAGEQERGQDYVTEQYRVEDYGEEPYGAPEGQEAGYERTEAAPVMESGSQEEVGETTGGWQVERPRAEQPMDRPPKDTRERRADDLTQRFLNEELAGILRAAEESAERIVERARSTTQHQIAQSNRLWREVQAEVSRFAEWRDEVEPIIQQVQGKVDAVRGHIEDVPEKIRQALAPLSEAISSIDGDLSELAAASTPPLLLAPSGMETAASGPVEWEPDAAEVRDERDVHSGGEDIQHSDQAFESNAG